MKSRWALVLALYFSVSAITAFAQENTPGNIEPPGKIVLIIDDMGNNLALGLRAIALPGPINYAFLPHSPHSPKLANKAHRQAKEILLHAPMSNLLNRPTGPGTLKPIMDRQQFLQTLSEDLASVPHVSGLNNHMGSLLTQLRQPMNWLMQALKQQQLYFIDSRTSPLTVAESTAVNHQLPTLKRDVFLDNKREHAAIDEQFQRLITLAKTNGIAVAIGHPYPETLAYLEQSLPLLASKGISLTLASNALNTPACNTIDSPCSKPVTLASIKPSDTDK